MLCTQTQSGVLLQATMESAPATEGVQTHPHIEQVVKELKKRLADHDKDIRKVVQHYFAHQFMQVDFVKWFNRITPPCLDEFYHDDPEIPPIAEDQIGKSPLVIVRLTCFAWDIGKFNIKDSEDNSLGSCSLHFG